MNIYISAKFTIFCIAISVALGAKSLMEYDPIEFQRAVLQEHNRLRAKHNVPPLFKSDVVS